MRREVRQALNISNTQLNRFIERLTDLEYIQSTGGYANKGIKYKIVWWDDYVAFRSKIKKYLLHQIENLPQEAHLQEVT